MKFVNYKLLCTIVVTVLLFNNFITYAEQMKENLHPISIGDYVPVVNPVLDFDNFTSKNENPQAMDFTTIDSMANLYSYIYIMNNSSYIYDRSSENFMTLKRGFNTNNADGNNTLYNLFLRVSEDKGQTWGDPITYYDADAIGWFHARYPSLYGFMMNNEQMVAATFPVIDYNDPANAVWHGFLTEIWDKSITDISSAPIFSNEDFTYDGVLYDWGIASRILAWSSDDNTSYTIASVGIIDPKDENDNTHVNNIGLRLTTDLGNEVTQSVPPQWTTEAFNPGGNYCQIVDFERTNNGTMYLAMYGVFRTGEEYSPNRVGVSKSTDNGVTWSDFNVLSLEAMQDYFNSTYGLPGLILSMGYYQLYTDQTGSFYATKGFAGFDNGDYSFVLSGLVIDTLSNPRSLIDSVIFEASFESGKWSIRKIANYQPNRHFFFNDVTITDRPEQRLTPSDREIQLSATVDENSLVAKWMDIVVDESSGVSLTSDIFISTRRKNGKSWSQPINITQSNELDRICLISDYLPNDLTNIPLLKLVTDLPDSQGVAGRTQYLQVGYFNAPVGVEDYEFPDSKLKLEILPNPVSTQFTAKIYYEGKPVTTEIAIYDLLGRKVGVVYNGEINYGSSSYQFNTAELNSGVYYCSITVHDMIINRMINIIK